MTSAITHLVRWASIATALALLRGCDRTGPAAKPPPLAQVSVVTVHRQSVPITFELPGRTSPLLVAQVRARVDGVVLQRDFKEGSDVKAGQRLYQVDPAPYIAALDGASASLQRAQAALVSTSALVERYKTLAPLNAISKQDYDSAVAAQGQADADVAAARASVSTARINLGYTTVRSPITGRSGISPVTQGAYVQGSAATLMTTVQTLDPMYVDLTQSSVEGLRLRRDVASGKLKVTGPGQAKVVLTLEDGKPYASEGRLQFSDITVNQGTGSVTVRAIFPNPQSILLPGMFVRARIEAGVDDTAILVPQTGVTHDAQGNATALVVEPDGKVATRALTLGDTSGDAWVVEGGLADGERVIVGGLPGARPGARVEVVDSAASSAIPSRAAASSTAGASTPAGNVAASRAPSSVAVK
jgi:membrane fusion protein (multidrug efflux system)